MSSAQQEVAIGEGANGGTIAVAKGSVVALKLPAVPGTGYVWTISRNDPAVLEPIGQSAFEPVGNGEGEDKKRLGKPAHQVFRFTAKAPGTADLRLLYKRPWEAKAEPQKRFRVRLTVR